MEKYYDKNGDEIKRGMLIKDDDGKVFQIVNLGKEGLGYVYEVANDAIEYGRYCLKAYPLYCTASENNIVSNCVIIED